MTQRKLARAVVAVLALAVVGCQPGAAVVPPVLEPQPLELAVITFTVRTHPQADVYVLTDYHVRVDPDVVCAPPADAWAGRSNLHGLVNSVRSVETPIVVVTHWDGAVWIRQLDVHGSLAGKTVDLADAARADRCGP